MRAKTLVEELGVRTAVGKREFPDAVRRAGLNYLDAHDRSPVEAHDSALVIGIATWSDSDLDALEQYVARANPKYPPVFVFDVDHNSLLTTFFQGNEAIEFLDRKNRSPLAQIDSP